MATFVTRAQWGARAPRNVPTDITPSRGGVTVHHVGGTRLARARHADCAAQVRGIQGYHMDTNGWWDIAYSHLSCVHGYLYEGRGEGVRTAANGTGTGNRDWYAVCGLTGGSADAYDTVTSGLIDAVTMGVARLRALGGAGSAVNGHRDHLATACPGGLYDRVTGGDFAPGALRTHTVRSGDTLYSIGRQYGVAWGTVAARNGIIAPYTIYSGQRLLISYR